MEIIAHRGLWSSLDEQNTGAAIEAALRAGLSLETDIRSFRGEIFVSHDPIRDSDGLVSFDTLVTLAWRHPTSRLFLNVKEDGLLDVLLRERWRWEGIGVVFFDMSGPELVRYAGRLPASMLATRASDLEPVPVLADRCGWVWVDGFERDLGSDELSDLMRLHPDKSWAFVSPELHGRDPVHFWAALRSGSMGESGRLALCTDRPVEWREERR